MLDPLLLAVAKPLIEQLGSYVGGFAAEEFKGVWNAKENLKKMKTKLTAICAVLKDAEETHYSNEAFKVWLRELKMVVYDIDDLLDQVATNNLLRNASQNDHLLEQAKYYLSLTPLCSRLHLSHKLNELGEKLDEIEANKNAFDLTQRLVEKKPFKKDPLDTYAYVNVPDVVGRDEDKADVISLLSNCNGNKKSGLIVASIVGFGGIGKTALAKLLFNDAWVDCSNFEVKLWACVTHEFDFKKTLKNLIKSYTDVKIDTRNCNVGQLDRMLRSILADRKFFVVLDDVWIEHVDDWKKLEHIFEFGRKGSVVLVTTRSERVVQTIDAVFSYPLKTLPDDVCWSLFKQLAFREGEESKYPKLVEIGHSIVAKCGGVPLVVRTGGALLRNTERDEGEWIGRLKDMDTASKMDDRIKSALRLSYDNLPSHLKTCFATLAILPRCSTLSMWHGYWSALGLLQAGNCTNQEFYNIGDAYIKELVARCFLHDPQVSFDNLVVDVSMHDLLHDLASNIVGEEVAMVTTSNLQVSEITRHIIWGRQRLDELSNEEFPRELKKVKKVRTFQFGYKIGRVSDLFIEGVISNFSYVGVLKLGNHGLRELPKSIGDLIHLRYLDMGESPCLKALPSTLCKLVNLQTLITARCLELQELPEKFGKMVSLKFFRTSITKVTFGDMNICSLSSLERLHIGHCKNLKWLWRDEPNAVHQSNLLFLTILDCPKLTSLPDCMKDLVSLKSLMIRKCDELDLERGNNLHGLRNLQTLRISEVPKMTHLPDGIRSAWESLQYLYIEDCNGLTVLPDFSQTFTSLRRLIIDNCPKSSAPPTGFRCNGSLQKLFVRECPHLTRRLAPDDGEDYPHIRHVPAVCLNGRRIHTFPSH